MTSVDVTTLEETRDEATVFRGRRYRRVGLSVLLLVELCGLAGLLGIRSATDTASGGGYTGKKLTLTELAPATSGQKKSAAPQGDTPIHEPSSEENKPKKAWVEIKLADSEGQPIAGEPYLVKLPDGTSTYGTTDSKG